MICEHDLEVVEDRDLPQYCWFSRCRKCGAECNDPSELVSDTPRTDAALVVEGSVAAKEFGYVNADFARQLERENRRLGADAARYQWLREAKFIEIVTEHQMFRVAGGENLDKTVDVAATP